MHRATHIPVRLFACAVPIAAFMAIASPANAQDVPAQAPVQEPQATPWAPQQPPLLPGQPQMLPPEQVRAAPQVVYVDAYGRPVGAENGGPMYGTTFGPMPPPPRPRPPIHLRGFMGVQLGGAWYQESPYRTASRAWGYDAFGSGLNIAVDGGVHVHNAVLIGGRFSWTNASGGQASYDGAEMRLNTFDFSIIARVGYPVPLGSHDWIFFPGVQAEFGGLYASSTLRLAASGALIPRAAGQIALIFSDAHVGIGLRIGYQYASWSDAAGSGQTLSLGGLLTSLGIEVRL